MNVQDIIIIIISSGLFTAIFTTLLNRRLYKSQLHKTDTESESIAVKTATDLIEQLSTLAKEARQEAKDYKIELELFKEKLELCINNSEEKDLIIKDLTSKTNLNNL